MANTTISRGQCLAPFYAASGFQSSGGYLPGRYCAIFEGVDCCLPCPVTDWVYPSTFSSKSSLVGALNVIGFALVAFTLLSLAILPKEKTRRHYLNVGLLISIAMLELGFIIPLGAKPEQCFNEITPNDMHTNLACAWSGAFAVAGGVSITMWIFVRCLSMHLQICWNIIPGTRFFAAAQAFSWGVATVLLTACLAVTGVSYRFGDFCLVNEHEAAATLWGPLLGFAALIVILQVVTFFYCLKVYLVQYLSKGRNNRQDTLSPSITTADARALKRRDVYKRVTKVFQLQWRSLAIASLVLIIIVLLAVVFIVVDAESLSATHNSNLVLPWAVCLVENAGDSDKCLDLARPLAPNEGLLFGTLVMLSIVGIAAYLLLTPLAVLKAWWEYIMHMRKLKHSPSPEVPEYMTEFVDRRPAKGMLSTVASRVSTNPDGLRSHSVRPPCISVRSESPDFLHRHFDKDFETSDQGRSSIGEPAPSSIALDWNDRYSFAESTRHQAGFEKSTSH